MSISILGDSKTELGQSALHKELEELKRNTALYFKRFKKEKRVRRRLQEQLEMETKRREQVQTNDMATLRSGDPIHNTL